MRTFFRDMKLNNFDTNGNYLGINMNGSSFLDRDSSKDIDMYTCEDHDMYINFMKFILDKSLTGPVITGTYTLSDFMTKNYFVTDHDVSNSTLAITSSRILPRLDFKVIVLLKVVFLKQRIKIQELLLP